MRTMMANKATVEKKWYVIDADGKVLGRVASEAAKLLRGKHKATFTPNVDCGDNVIIINSDKLVLTGKKEEQKYFKRYSGYQSGLKEIQYKKMNNNKETLSNDNANINDLNYSDEFVELNKDTITINKLYYPLSTKKVIKISNIKKIELIDLTR